MTTLFHLITCIINNISFFVVVCPRRHPKIGVYNDREENLDNVYLRGDSKHSFHGCAILCDKLKGDCVSFGYQIDKIFDYEDWKSAERQITESKLFACKTFTFNRISKDGIKFRKVTFNRKHMYCIKGEQMIF